MRRGATLSLALLVATALAGVAFAQPKGRPPVKPKPAPSKAA